MWGWLLHVQQLDWGFSVEGVEADAYECVHALLIHTLLLQLIRAQRE
jgi:hypothetical protein